MVYLGVLSNSLSLFVEEAKRFEDGLQEQKDFLYIQRKYVSTYEQLDQ